MRERRLPSEPGTYALILELSAARALRVGGLGVVRLPGSVLLYAGSAFGPGGLRARLLHHLRPSPRPHWHIDHLRRAAGVAEVWATRDPRRLECVFAAAARALRGARDVPGFGASDCRCPSHLVALPRVPRRRAFRRGLRSLAPPCAAILRFEP